jgi:phosphate/sulfate permease
MIIITTAMPELYFVILILLFIFAISDLIVGVSNDAVNFLNSAIGSKVAPRKIIMIVASLGILIGATFSSGMMEVARKGIFNPEYFFFAEIMIIFLAVMITDIILLDLFNTFGMPTSTTVSIVFELLGAAVAISILKITANGDSLSTLGNYINSSSAILIISGIFISVLIAFVIGSLVQYLSRLLFTFHLNKRMLWVGPLWSGLALSALTYFLLIKGIKGASFISDDFIAWVQNNTLQLIGIAFLVWSIVMFICLRFFKVNILKIVVLFGTFALAMAFAGNDLVNFIGVPVAGFESYLAWQNSGVEAGDFNMAILNEPVRTKTYLLLIAGLIMIVTLWFSKKARSVTETEVNLGRQDEGNERFKPNSLAKGIVRYSLFLGNKVNTVLPNSWKDRADQSFEPQKEVIQVGQLYDPPAFDLVRASVNLTVASILIAFATSLKLPLSTTYVSFMVAMGTSLADRAWGRSSAVFRIAGVINVIGGWFFTAIIAFAASATFASLIYWFGSWAIGGLVLLAIFLISRTFLLHRNKEKEKAAMKAFEQQTQKIPTKQIVKDSAKQVLNILEIVKTTYQNAIIGLLEEDLKLLQKAREDVKQLKFTNGQVQQQLFGLIKRIDEESSEGSRLYLLAYDLSQDIVQSTSLIAERCLEYVDNSLEPIDPRQEEQLRIMMVRITQYISHLIEETGKYEFDKIKDIIDQKQSLYRQVEEQLSLQVQGIKEETFGMRNSQLIFSIVLESKDLIAVAARFAKLYHRVEQLKDRGEGPLLGSNKS